MPATSTRISTVFQPLSYRLSWETEMTTPKRTAHAVQHNAAFFNSPNSQTVFSHDRDTIREDWERDFERRLEALVRQLQHRLSLQSTVFEHINPETIIKYTGLAALVFLVTNADEISADATADTSIFFTAVYAQFGRIYFEIYFADELDEPLEAVVNIYSTDNQCVLAYAGSLIDTLSQTFEFIRTKLAF